MARNWRRLVLAAAIASALASLPLVPDSWAQTVPSSKAKTAKKTAKPQPGASDDTEALPQKKKKQDPAEAQKAIEAAQRMLEAGKADAAVQSLSATLSAGNLPPALMARALLYRGIGHRQMQKPAQAISDLTSALWLKGGLGEADRADALKQRASAYAEAGLSDTGSPVAAVPRAPGGSVRTASTGDPGTPPSPPQSPLPGGGTAGWNIFGGLFGSGPSAPPPAPSPPPQKTASIAPAPAPAGWTSVEVKPSQVAVAPAPAPVPVPQTAADPPRPAARPDGKFRVQLGLVRSESEAGAIASRVRSDLAAVFESREASIDQAVVGNMGTMYRVRVGPYANAGEGQAACNRLKGSGLDCLVVSQ